ncbi:hypothetical protein CTAYLR_010573 [Chrysophaeum taylorii]|uniref:FHA domain-containing protein n=1 Tax=Chrysophaeum taylorii TaxID=2483200 RepID=A0AAD7U8I7_9STRA|nr:hypothetical protein CTAYLR_010573 [Chrysophaeum taylorii]
MESLICELEALKERLEGQRVALFARREETDKTESALADVESAIRDLRREMSKLRVAREKVRAAQLELPTWIVPGFGILEIWKEGEILKKIELKGKEFFVLGRKDSDLVLDHASVSRHHVVLLHGTYEDRTGWFAKDLGSAHGTFLDGERITEIRSIPEPSILRVAKSTREYRIRMDDHLPLPSQQGFVEQNEKT